jgi:hypothetical protein
MTLKIHHFL